jgi:hypothetical protein
MHNCIRCELSVPNVKFQTPGSKHCIKCSNALYYIRNKKDIAKRYANRYYANLEHSRKINAQQRRKWRAANPDKVKIENKKKYDKVKADPIKYQKALIATKKLKKEKRYNHLEQSYRDRSKENLTDNFVKRTLLPWHSNVIKYSDIPQELIDMKRTQLLLKRQIA